MRVHVKTVIALAAILALTTCGDRLSDSPPEQSNTPACAPADYAEQVNAFCRRQNPEAPAAGALGGSCANNDQCGSKLCLQPFGSASSYCTVKCPGGNECPKGFACQDAGGTLGPVCYRGVCSYASESPSSCVVAMDDEIEAACQVSCKAQLEAWLACIGKGERVCSRSEAEAACGIERGALESCCPGCSDSL